MAIFGRRRASSNPRPSTTSSSSAATLAASQAFLANKTSNANLSNAAATAALRAHTPNPTPVGQIQTKRMQRRGSLTSQTSAPDGRSFKPGGLQRRDSGGSMTERTFRSPSPGTPRDHRERPASSHGPYPLQDQHDTPPVPALPRNYVTLPQTPNASAQRIASIEPLRRISSPPPKEPGGRGLDLDTETEVINPTATKSKEKKAPESMGDLERAGSRSPVNFSRPMSPENAIPKSPLAGGRVRSPPPPISSQVAPLVDGDQRQELTSPQNTSVAPVKKKKKKKRAIITGPVEGSDLIGDRQVEEHPRTVSEAIPQQQAIPAVSTPKPASLSESDKAINSPQPKKMKKKTMQTRESKSGVAESFGAAYPSDTDSVTSERSSTTDRPRYYNTRAAGLLAKQPSIVREDREGEEEAEEGLQASEIKSFATSNGNAIAETQAISRSKGRQHGRSASQQVTGQTPNLDIPGVTRHASLSPGRTAHFSVQPVNEGKKHQPPGRSVSPAKSALKSSPSRGHSPMVTRRGLAPSDASDSTSQYSDDGTKSSIRKKNARVSFDEEPVIVGHAASPPSIPGSPNIVSPQSRSSKTRTWIDLVREKQHESLDSDHDNDSTIKPTPALPSFGSVRGREPKLADETLKQVDRSSDWSRDMSQTLDTSTDKAIASVSATDNTKKRIEESQSSPMKPGSNDPLPPEVTSVEGSGYHSNEGDFSDEEDKKSELSLLQAHDASRLAPVTKDVEQPRTHVPQIAVQPATPGPDLAMTNRDSWLDMPGGFPSQKESEGELTSTAGSMENQMPATMGIAEPKAEAAVETTHPTAPIVGEGLVTLPTQIPANSRDESEDSTSGSIYSDAAEDQSDLEGDGFGSINAIVESPTSPNLNLVDKSLLASPLGDTKETLTQPWLAESKGNELSEPASSEGWDRAQAYWSGLSQKRKQQLEQAALPGAIDEPVIRNRSMRGTDAINKEKRKKKKKAKKMQLQPLGSSITLPPTSTVAPSQKAASRPSSPPSSITPQLRLSMRDEPSKSALKTNDKRSSMQPQSPPKPALQKKIRPMSAAAAVDYKQNAQNFSPTSPRAVSGNNPARPGSAIPAQQQRHIPVSKPRVHHANSDSDSSFKKSPAKAVAGQRYTMRRSMRIQPNELGSARASSVAARAASPAEAKVRRAFSQTGPNGSVGIRTSMRGSVDASKPARTSFRNSLESGKANRTKSPSRFSFLGSSRTKSVATEVNSTPRFPSRFVDSSDEENLPTMASSRFADSSDDDGSPGLTPVRGIPRRVSEGDSTDLDDSSEGKVPPPTKPQSNVSGSANVQAPSASGPEGPALAIGSLRTASDVPSLTPAMGTDYQAKKAAEKEKTKRSFFGSLSGRKHDGSSGTQKSDIESRARAELLSSEKLADSMTPKLNSAKSSGHVLGPSSLDADPVGMPTLDTHFSTGSRASRTQNSPKSPKLQRRITPKRITSSNGVSWPLPQNTVDSVEVSPRPKTSDGTAATNSDPKPEPSLVLRPREKDPVRGAGISGATLASPNTTTKKKKFSILRKAFGL